MLDVLTSGKLSGDPELLRTKVGKPFASARLRVSMEDQEKIIISVSAFEKATMDALLALKSGDAASIAGSLKIKLLKNNDGIQKQFLNLTAAHILTPSFVKKKRTKQQYNMPLINKSGFELDEDMEPDLFRWPHSID